jgi:Ner family transcriptional regulator
MTDPNTQNCITRDWHPWDIKAALGKKGYSLTRVAMENGYAQTSPSEALRKAWPAMERIFADIIGKEPWEIWPSRYDNNNQPLRCHGTTVTS